MLNTLLTLFFPKELTDYFDLMSHRKYQDERIKAMILDLTFEEKNDLPKGYSTLEYKAIDFKKKTILDVPILHRLVNLVIRRRRWRHNISGQLLQRDLRFIAKDEKFTKDLVTFLKGGD